MVSSDEILIDGYEAQTTEVQEYDGMSTAPSTSPADKARIYFNSVSDKLKLSENSGTYSNIATEASGDAIWLNKDGSNANTDIDIGLNSFATDDHVEADDITLTGILTGVDATFTGDIIIDSDSSTLQLGDTPATDYTIGFNGTNAVHTITAGEYNFVGGDVEITAGNLLFNRAAVSVGFSYTNGIAWSGGSFLLEQTSASGGVNRMFYAPVGDRIDILAGGGQNYGSTIVAGTFDHNRDGTTGRSIYGVGGDVYVEFNAADMEIGSLNVTANDELLFIDFDQYVFDNDITTTGTLTSNDHDILDDTPHLRFWDTDNNITYEWHLDPEDNPYQNYGLWRGVSGAVSPNTPLMYFDNSNYMRMGNDVLITVDVNSGLIASITQTQGQGALTAQVNEISTVANNGDNVTLPSAVTGIEIEIINNGANTLRIFPASGDDLGLGPNTFEELEANERVKFVAYDTTNWAKESTTEIIHAEIHDEDNTDAFVVNAEDDFHAYHTNGLAAGDLADWAFDAGGVGTSHAIASIADGVDTGNDIEVTTADNHLLADGDIVSQTNLTSAVYTGIFVVKDIISPTQYEVAAAYTATDTGTMDQAATLEADAVAAGVYNFVYYISGTPVGANETFDFQLYKGVTAVVGSKVRRKFGGAGDFGSMAGGGVVAVGNGEKISFALSNEDSAANLIIRNLTIVLIRL